ncbi:MAG: type II toxin-antitoxin system VapC family toxin [Methylobacter sp.]|uniref:type II toxin-antitoxin system VapC family toxin n=1 Tax=Methylobacter sp. TaxID=2051955 RepID=UPI0025DF47C8|nr:type II toxin-antitoxin system VapC family toxin [Methylobacter sp.]MCK9621968.1 type II toxin-antitoxin system VapC family toxin [Methylobacter sp.]
MLVDTDVLIWYLKGNDKARHEIEVLPGFFISVVTYIELVQGMRNKQELVALRRALRLWNAKMLYISEDISAKAMFYVEQYYLSHSMQLADALIGATAVANGLDLLTGNAKHYRVLKDISIREFKPV